MDIPGRKLFKDESVFTGWFPRGGDNVILRADKVAFSGTTTATIYVFTKNSETEGDGKAVEEAGAGTTPLSFTVASGDTTVKELVVSSLATSDTDHPKGLLELVRLKIAVTTATNASDFVQVRLFPPIFFNEATA